MVDARVCDRALEILASSQLHWRGVSSLIPKGEFYRCAESCRDGRADDRYAYATGPTIRTFVQLVATARFITLDELVPSFTASKLMGRESLHCASLQGRPLIVVEDGSEVILTSEDYLQGVISMVNELVRLNGTSL